MIHHLQCCAPSNNQNRLHERLQAFGVTVQATVTRMPELIRNPRLLLDCTVVV